MGLMVALSKLHKGCNSGLIPERLVCPRCCHLKIVYVGAGGDGRECTIVHLTKGQKDNHEKRRMGNKMSTKIK